MTRPIPYSRIASQVFGIPLLIAESHGLIIAEYLASRIDQDPAANAFRGAPVAAPGRDQKPVALGYRRAGNVAIVNLHGELVNRGAWMGASSGLTSYEGFTQSLKNAASDAEADSLIIDVNSPGGAAPGMIEAARAVREVSKSKPVTAIVNAMSFSAAMGVASGATEIVASESSELGSIGVLMVHFDRSAAMAERGVKVTMFHAGAHKVDMNPFGPMGEDSAKAIQDRIDRTMTAFVDLVASHRRISQESIRKTEAGILSADQAVKIGLADRIGTFDSVLDRLANKSKNSSLMPPKMPSVQIQCRLSAVQNNPEILACPEWLKAATSLAQVENNRMSAGEIVAFVKSTVTPRTVPLSAIEPQSSDIKSDPLAGIGASAWPSQQSDEWPLDAKALYANRNEKK